jgi:hypothetical protein
MITSPGGVWGFSQINLGTLWADAWGTAWFGSNKTLSLANSGPVFVEFNYTEAGGSDLWGTVYNYNVTTTSTVRIYYQPNLNPPVKIQRTFKIQTNLANYTIKGPAYLDFTLANSTSGAIYKDFVYNQGWFGTTTIPVETAMWQGIWLDAWAMYGWWSYNGTRADSSDKPAANIGMIPTYSGVSLPETADADYGLSLSQQIEYNNHHCTQWMTGKYNGTNGDYIQTTSYVFTYKPVDVNAEPTMNNEATRLRNPLGIQLANSRMRVGDLGGGVPSTFFNYDGKCDGKDLSLFLQCYKGLGPDH